ncbi:MAG: DUF7507 domain-containing protein, partial [Nocardioidaceae bacterium]
MLLAGLGAFGAAPGWAAVDLAVTKTASADTVATGDLLTYTVTVTNNGADQASDVSIRDPLKQALAFVSASPGCAVDQSTVRCTIGTLASTASAAVQINVRPVSQGTVTNTATASAAGQDADTQDNSFSVTTAVLGRSDLAVSVHDSPDPVKVGATLKYTLTVVNRGPDRATGVTLSDQLPANATVVSVPNGCSTSAGSVSCGISAIGSGKNITKVIRVRPNQQGTISNTASVATSTGQVDPKLSNNSAVQGTTVTGSRPAPPPPSCAGRTATIVDPAGGRSGTIVGTPGRDVILALGGNDTIRSGGGDDLICAG